ncbi:MAG: hypothetical protein GEU87_11705 [Alphaproteobacteria bacterium]|nr:hypothetical protein [Alphaproteobacteria bacterium]
MSSDELEQDSLVGRLERIFPYYLNAADKKALYEALRNYPANKHYFSASWEGPAEPLQGDAWNGFTKLDFQTADRLKIAGLILSNSCDIDEANASLRDRNVLFAPIVALSAYEDRLRRLPDLNAERIAAHVDAIRKQTKTDVFYLPASTNTPEAIVLFDDITAQPLSNFAETEERKRLFSLNNYGFYVLLMKLSIHFTRFGEELQRQG